MRGHPLTACALNSGIRRDRCVARDIAPRGGPRGHAFSAEDLSPDESCGGRRRSGAGELARENSDSTTPSPATEIRSFCRWWDVFMTFGGRAAIIRAGEGAAEVVVSPQQI